MKIEVLKYFICLFLFNNLAFTASFDCTKVSNNVESLICSDSSLSKLDEELSKTYKNVLNNTNYKDVIKTKQREWITIRNNCNNIECLEKLYKERLNYYYPYSDNDLNTKSIKYSQKNIDNPINNISEQKSTVTKIGFNGIYLGQNGKNACAILKNNFPNEKYSYYKKEEQDLYSSSDSCQTKSIQIYLDRNDKVEGLHFEYTVFSINKMSLNEFIKFISSNTTWLPLSNNININDLEYSYIDDKKFGFIINIDESTVKLYRTNVIK